MRRHARRIEIDQLAVAGAGLEQIAGALVAARLDVDHRADLGARCKDRADRARRPAAPASSPSVNTAMTGCSPPPSIPRAFRARMVSSRIATPDAVIAGAGSCGHGVAVRHQQDLLAIIVFRARRHAGDDVGDGAARDIVPALFANSSSCRSGCWLGRPSPPARPGCARAPLRRRRCRTDAAPDRPAPGPARHRRARRRTPSRARPAPARPDATGRTPTKARSQRPEAQVPKFAPQSSPGSA